MDSRLEDYRKKTSENGLRIAPTYLQWRDDLRVDDYRRKQTKKAEPNDPAFALLEL